MEYEFTPAILDRSICRDFERSTKMEWVDANGTGAYSMGTVAGMNTRRYHGLLVASLHPPVQRNVILSRLEERVETDHGAFEISTNQYKQAVHPRGFELMDTFRLDPFPQWSWQLGDLSLSKDVFLIPDRQAVAIVYSVNRPCTLRVKPLLAFRDYQDLQHRNDQLRTDVELHPDHIRMHLYPDKPTLLLHHSQGEFTEKPDWYFNFEYQMEMQRGMDCHEDLYSPGELIFNLQTGGQAFVVAAVNDASCYTQADLDSVMKQIRGSKVKGNSSFETKLTAASNVFRARRQDGRPTVLAGFPWFADWGRDTMISLPGLLITRGLLDDAKEVIESFLIHLNQGVIPNHYPDYGTPEYNTCDATLWMFQAVWSYMQCGGSLAWVRDVFYPILKEILEWHEKGTIYQIHMDPEDGLLSAGVDGVQLTWMDAKVGDWVVTPRRGKPVEVNALWYNALRIGAHWAFEFGEIDYGQKLVKMVEKARASFEAKFWNAEKNCLYDVLGEDGPDDKIRPNQLFAVSLPFDLFDRDKQRAIVTKVQERLLTRVGVRTLDPADPEYRPRYEGDRQERDGAYHQGTVWPWLLGPFVTAYLKAFGRSEETLHYCRRIVHNLEPEMMVDCVNNLNEIYDAEEPQTPRGCIAQAWSVGEILRLLRTDLI